MKLLYLLTTAVFWVGVALFGAQAARVDTPAPTAAPPAAAGAAPASTPAPERRITLAEVARHARPDDCWMAIDGSVYDFSAYLPNHPSEPQLIEPWCGREASEAYRTKTIGRPHSARAGTLMARYRIGTLAAGR